MFFLLVIAVAQDIRSGRVSNKLILFGLFLGLLSKVQEYDFRGIYFFLRNISVPVILFYLMFLMHVLGAGDIKLFSVIGGIWDLHVLITTIMISFLIAAGMSLGKLLYHHNLISRLCIFGKYIHEVITTFQLPEYPKGAQEKQHIIHFSIAILIGFLITLEVAH